MTKVAVKVTPQGVLVPSPLIQAWGDVKEVEIEQRPDALIITPKEGGVDQVQARVVSEMKAAGLIEDLPWAQPREVSSQERADLAEKLGCGEPLSQVILEDRESYE